MLLPLAALAALCAADTFPPNEKMLQDLYAQTGGPQWTQQSGWSDQASDPCDTKWAGVVCDEAGYVVGLELSGFGIRGPLPSGVWAGLARVQALDLSKNSISGAIPETLFEMRSLLKLNLEDNNLSGNIPDGVENAPALAYINLSNNKLSGPLNDAIWYAEKLELLNLSHNALGGELSDSVATLDRLRVLDISHNKFRGPLPPKLGRMRKLQLLQANDNYLEGPVPKSFAKAKFKARLANNRFACPLPSYPVLEGVECVAKDEL